MSVTTRFAPSPTGGLHLGHAFSAILAHDFARERHGNFLLRIEDIDAGRSRPEHVDGIFIDLEWLGLGWDGEVVFQSERLDRYAAALQRLRAAGLAYPCFCTRADIAREIAAAGAAPHGPEPAYPGTCRALGAAERADRIAAGMAHAWRLDAVAAGAAPDNAHGDVVLARKDAPTSYHLAVVVDDAAQGVTDVVRGRDLEPAVAVHRLLQQALGLPMPEYHHHDLLADASGRRLAKRDRSATLAALRAGGMNGHQLAQSLRARRFPLGIRLLDP